MAAMTTAERFYPHDAGAGERALLESWLEFHRETLAHKCAGLDDAQLREQAAPPSELSLLGLVRHMAEVERNWFQRVLGERMVEPVYGTEQDLHRAVHLRPEDSVEEGFATWRREIERARAAARGVPLAARCRRPSDGEEFSLRWIYVHMIEEYARHNGHADLLRERLDGATGL